MPAGTGNTDSEPSVVSIHGAGLRPWIWDEWSASLAAPHFAASFPGRDERTEHLKTIGLAEYVDHVQHQIENWAVENVVLVVHSIGGVVGLEVARRLPDRVVGFVGVCAAIPKPGESFLSCYPFHQRLFRRAIMRVAGTKPPDATVRRSLGEGVSDDTLDRIVYQFIPEARRLYTDRITAPPPPVSTAYIKTMRDAEFAPALQDSMIANLEVDEVATIDAGHLPMLSHPYELADIVNAYLEE